TRPISSLKSRAASTSGFGSSRRISTGHARRRCSPHARSDARSAAAEGTARLAVKRSTLSEYPTKTLGGPDHVEALSSVLAAFGKLARTAIDNGCGAGVG